jgi:hypothetical protein
MTNVLGLDDFVTELRWMKSRESPISSPILDIYATFSTDFRLVNREESPQSHLRIYAARDKLYIN